MNENAQDWVLVVSHGSRSDQTVKEVEILVKNLKERLRHNRVQYAFLELQEPDIESGIVSCIRAGAKKVIVVLNFLNAGRHVNHDIPEIVNATRHQYPDIDICMTSPLSRVSGYVQLFVDEIHATTHQTDD